jgi:tellurite resistance protein TerC
MAFEREQAMDVARNPVLRVFTRVMPIAVSHHDDPHFFVKLRGVWHATPLFVTLLIVEASDLIFAIDSIPAVLAISHDPFIVYTSNAFAILGLRTLYFLLSGVMGMFRYLKVGVSIVLVYVGFKMLLSDVLAVPIGVSLGIIGGVLMMAVIASLIPAKPAVPHPPRRSPG